MSDFLDNCIFCSIANKKAESSILYEDDDFLLFEDIKPAAKIHYLCIPKKHLVSSAKELTKSHENLISSMIEVSKKFIGEIPSVRFGFHWPPFTLVKHLHMHIISPVEELSLLNRIIYRPNSWWFVTDTALLDLLKNK